MLYLLDTDVVSALMLPRPKFHVARRLASVAPEDLCTSAITLAELLYGAERRASAALRRMIAERMEGLPILPFDESAARIYGPLKADLQRKGTPLDEPDLRIASTALANGLTVITGNVRHFDRVPGLTIENWLVES
jgi:tRNA(fMet)-specific endonuclease VapC